MQPQFDIIFEHGNGSVHRHNLVDTSHDKYAIHETIAIEKAMEGYKVEMMPEIVAAEIALRAVIFPGVKFRKNPDLRIDGEYVEVKVLESIKRRKIVQRINDAAEQANQIIIDIPEEIIIDDDMIMRRFGDNTELKTIQFRYKGKYTIIKRDEYIR